MDAPRNTLRVARRVRRRALAAGVLRRAGVGLVVGSAAGLGAVLAQRMGWWRPDQDWGTDWWVLVGVAAGVGLLGGAVSGLIGRRSLLAAAQRADRALGLRDGLSNALSFAEGAPGPAEQLAIRDAERLAETVSPGRVVPIRFNAAWAVWPPVLAASVATGIWAPQRQPAPTVAAEHRASEPERRAAAETLASAADSAREVADTLTDRAGQEQLDRVAELERELIDGTRSPEDALAEGARRLDSLAEHAEREAATDSLADQATRERLADRIDAGENDSALSRALADGDLRAARDAAADLVDRYDRMSPEERARYADELDRLARQLQGAGEAQPAQGQQQGREQGREQEAAPDGGQGLDEALRRQGIDRPEDLSGSTDPDALRDELEKRGVEPEAARDLAERVAERNQQTRADEQAQRDMQDLEQSAREAAKELREPPPPTTPERATGQDRPEPARPEGAKPEEQPGRDEGKPQPGRDEQPQGGQGEKPQQPGARSDQPREQRQGDQQRQGEQGRQQEDSTRQPGGQQGERQGERQGQGQQQEGQGQQGQQQEGQGQQSQQQEGQGQQGQQQEGQGARQGEGQREGETAQGREGAERGQDRELRDGRGGAQGQQPGAGRDRPEGQAPGEQPGQQPGAQPDGPSRMTDGSGDAPDAGGVERLRRQLERMAERGGNADQRRQSAEKLREQARRMLEQATPEERREMERLAREMAERSGPGSQRGAGADRSGRPDAGARPAPQREWGQEDFDARAAPGDEQPRDGQVIADWYGDDTKAPAGGATPSSGPAVARAAKSVERALERRAIPRERQDLVRRVFERFRERAAEREGDAGKTGGSGSGAADDS